MKRREETGDCEGATSCGGADGREHLKAYVESEQLKERMSKIEHKIMILSGKGGVGKSTVAANTAIALALRGNQVGLLDVDFHGPSIPKLLGLEGQQFTAEGNEIIPVDYGTGIKVMSLGFLLPTQDTAVIWRGPVKMGAIKQLLTDVRWGKLDYLVIDFPPGTGDEALSVAQLIPDADGAVIVTTPQDIALSDVRKSIDFCRQLKIRIIGLIENMSGLVCPHCKTVINVFKQGGGESMAKELGVPFLGHIPIEPQIVEASDCGQPFCHMYDQTVAAASLLKIVEKITGTEEGHLMKNDQNTPENRSDKSLRIAVPIANGRLCSHFGHCDTFAVLDVDMEKTAIMSRADLIPPPHEPGLLPRWLQEKGANIVIAGGMGSRAQGLFAERGIKVITGASSDEPEKLVMNFMKGSLMTGDNVCDH
jgi:ATP-binding protein involved in chromosome partitioning